MFPSPFPQFISFHCQHRSSPAKFPLLPEEEASASTISSAKRRAEFSLGRSCAHQALSRFNLEDHPILKNGDTREPCWPEAIRGSITHSENRAAAAVASTEHISGIGIDLESLARPVDFNIRKHICTPAEREQLESLPTECADRNLRIIFSAKESIFKCFFPVSKTFLYFQDAHITINEERFTFDFVLSKACSGISPKGFRHSGKYLMSQKMLLTSVYL